VSSSTSVTGIATPLFRRAVIPGKIALIVIPPHKCSTRYSLEPISYIVSQRNIYACMPVLKKVRTSSLREP